MASPKITLSMRGGGDAKVSGEVDATVGGQINVQYDPAKASASIDYTQPDKIVVKIAGEVSLQAVGIPAVTLGGGVTIDDKGRTYRGSLEWAIDASVSAKVDLQHAPSGSSGLMTVSLKF